MGRESSRGSEGIRRGEVARAGGRKRQGAFFVLLITALFLGTLGSSSAAAAPPEVVSTFISEAQTSSARLNAEVNPSGSPTTYRFEYGPEDCAVIACAKTETSPVGSGTSPVTVSAKVEGLTPGTKYHFRVIANSIGGKKEGPDTTFRTYGLPQAFAPCANDAFRTSPPQPSAALPDCRAYEQASPVQKNGLDSEGRVSLVKASPQGDRVSFLASGGMPGTEGAQDIPTMLASRGGGNWSTQGLLPPETVGEEAFVTGWTPDFAQVFDSARKFNGAGGGTFLSRSSADSSLSTIAAYGQGLGTQPPVYSGASANGAEVLFESNDKLASVPAAIQGKPNLYLWNRESGQISLAGVMNDEAAPPAGAFAGPYNWFAFPRSAPNTNQGGAGGTANYYTQDEKAISPDGASVFFTEAGTGQVYVRRNPTQPQSSLNGSGECEDPAKACTIRISKSEKTNGQGANGSDAAGTRPAAFIQASADGSSALLTSTEKLTNDANTGPESQPPSIGRANLDGSGKNLSLLLGKAKGIAVDGTHIYWADSEDGTIGRAELGGANPEPDFISKTEIEVETETETDPGVFVTESIANPQYVAVDAGHIYWTNATNGAKEAGTIGRAELGGANPEAEFITGATNPQGIAVDPTYIYWSNAGDEDATRAIGRAELSGSAGSVNQDFIQFGLEALELKPQGIAVNGTHIYATMREFGNSSYIFRYKLDGELASRVIFAAGQNVEAQGVTLDSTYLYFAQKGIDAIGRLKLSDFKAATCAEIASCEGEFIKEASRPLGLAVDGAHIYWAANQGSPPNPGNDLYRYEENAPAGEHLSDLTAESKDTNGAQVVGVLGASEDLSTVYFAANGDLDGAGPAQAGDCEGFGPGAFINFEGECSLYVAREGQPTAFLGRLHASPSKALEAQTDATNWLPRGGSIGQVEKTARVSPDGKTLLFRSQSKLTPYDNKGVPELYLYRAGQGIGCVSCNPTGEGPGGVPKLGSIALANFSSTALSFTLSRNLSADGTRVFFETTDRLAAEDTNGEGGCPLTGSSNGSYPICMDVYEWEAAGTGSCEEELQAGGCLYLLSTGKSDDASFFADASASGDDAFLVTRSALVRQDGDQLTDVYDAHVKGGLAAQNQVSSSCESLDACHPAGSQPPAFESPGTATFSGPGNQKAKQAKKKKHHKKQHQKKHRKRAANHNRRAGR